MTEPKKRKHMKASEFFAGWGGCLSWDEHFELRDTSARDCHLFPDIPHKILCNYVDLTAEFFEEDVSLSDPEIQSILQKRSSHNSQYVNDKDNGAAIVQWPTKYKRRELLDSYRPSYGKSTRVAESQKTLRSSTGTSAAKKFSTVCKSPGNKGWNKLSGTSLDPAKKMSEYVSDTENSDGIDTEETGKVYVEAEGTLLECSPGLIDEDLSFVEGVCSYLEHVAFSIETGTREIKQNAITNALECLEKHENI